MIQDYQDDIFLPCSGKHDDYDDDHDYHGGDHDDDHDDNHDNYPPGAWDPVRSIPKSELYSSRHLPKILFNKFN